jgi:hypothetical protein
MKQKHIERLPKAVENLLDQSNNVKMFEISSSFKHEVYRVLCWTGKENDEYYQYFEYSGTENELAEHLKILEWRIYKINHRKEFSNYEIDLLGVSIEAQILIITEQLRTGFSKHPQVLENYKNLLKKIQNR